MYPKPLQARNLAYCNRMRRPVSSASEFFSFFFPAATVRSPRDQRVTLLLGSEDAVKVYLNGRLVHSNFV